MSASSFSWPWNEAARCGQLPAACSARPVRSAGSWCVTLGSDHPNVVAEVDRCWRVVTVLCWLRSGRSFWPKHRGYRGAWRRATGCGNKWFDCCAGAIPRSKSAAYCAGCTPVKRSGTRATRPSTRRCTRCRKANCALNSSAACGRLGAGDFRGRGVRIDAGKLPTWSRSTCDRLRSRSASFRDTGRAT